MGHAAASSASTISVLEVLALFDGDFQAVAQGLANGEYAFWLGSGISRGRVDDLKSIIRKVLQFLQDRTDPSDPDCPYQHALASALDLALTSSERDTIHLDQPLSTWPNLGVIVDRLASAYSALLDIRIPGEPDDFLLWEAVDVVGSFGAATANHDCEHLCLGILALEGVAPEIASGNWDALIEAAVDELTNHTGGVVNVCVRADDLRGPRLLTRLLKFHGCAMLAASDPSQYRSLLIARQSQISDWPNDPAHAPMQLQLVNLAITRPTLMIGLSAQDSDIKDVFSKAYNQMRWPWPSNPPAYVFSGDTLGQEHLALLRIVYRSDYSAHSTEINRSALIRAYGKPLLAALVLYVLCAKLRAFARQSLAPLLSPSDFDLIETGLIALRNSAASASGSDCLDFVSALVRVTSHGMSLFQEGTSAGPHIGSYRPLSASPVHHIPMQPGLAAGGMREFAVALGLLGRGTVAGTWTLKVPDPADPTGGVLRVTSSSGTTRVFFAANSGAAVQFEVSGTVSASEPDVVVVHSTAPVAPRRRSPHAAPGRIGRARFRQVGMADLLREARDIRDLERGFRQEALL